MELKILLNGIKMKVSIITPTFNSSKTIIDTLYSINKQSYDNIEHIIIDGNSTDETVDLCKKHAPKSIIISEKDSGIYDAMNKGINMSTGQIVGILNSDDFFINEKLIETIAESFRLDNNVQIIYGNLIYVSSYDTSFSLREWISKPYYEKYFEDSNVPPHPTLFLRKEVYKLVGNFNLDYKLAADYEFMFRLFKLHNLKSLYINMFFVKMRTGGATSKNMKNILIQNYEIYKCWKFFGYKLPFFFFINKILNRASQFYFKK
jgi:glycosyltransferase